jgi:opacity protein-like surface antigen
MVTGMLGFAARLGLALVLAVLSVGGRAAYAQAAPVRYWIPSWPLGFGNLGQSSDTYTDLPNGWFIAGQGGGIGLARSGINQAETFGSIGSLHYEGVQFGYNFQNGSALPLRVYAGVDTLKYDAGIGGPFAPFDSTPGTLPGYRGYAGVEFQPAPNVSFSVGFGYTQQSGRVDSDINSLSLPGASPFAISSRR